MPDGPYDDEDEMNSQFAGESQFASGSNPSMQPNSMPMPRKAIPRKQTGAQSFPSSEYVQPQNLDYGVHLEPEEGSGYAPYAPPPSKTALRKKAASGKEKLSSGSASTADNPLMWLSSRLPAFCLECAWKTAASSRNRQKQTEVFVQHRTFETIQDRDPPSNQLRELDLVR